jgi:hypothetical protein
MRWDHEYGAGLVLDPRLLQRIGGQLQIVAVVESSARLDQAVRKYALLDLIPIQIALEKHNVSAIRAFGQRRRSVVEMQQFGVIWRYIAGQQGWPPPLAAVFCSGF